MKEFVAGFLFNEDKTKVKMVLKNRPDFQNGKLNAIGGKIELNESPLDAMIREFEEETTLYFKDWKLYCHLKSPKDSDFQYIVYFYKAFVDNKTFKLAKTNTDEEIFDIEVSNILNEKTLSNVPYLLFLALNNDTVFAEIECY